MALISPVVDGEAIKVSEANKDKETKSNELGYDQFLQLLCAEMQYQDPLEPTSNTDYIAQLATFSQVEATLNMQNALQSLQGNDLVGKYVLLTNGEGGFVDYVQYENGDQTLYIGGNGYSLADIYQVVDTDYMEAMTIADAFKGAVDKLPDPEKLTLDDLKAVQDLVTVYESLTSYQKSVIDADTSKKYNALIAQMKVLLGNTSEDTGSTGGTEGSEGTEGTDPTGGTEKTE